jgi:hypothetical protein
VSRNRSKDARPVDSATAPPWRARLVVGKLESERKFCEALRKP